MKHKGLLAVNLELPLEEIKEDVIKEEIFTEMRDIVKPFHPAVQYVDLKTRNDLADLRWLRDYRELDSEMKNIVQEEMVNMTNLDEDLINIDFMKDHHQFEPDYRKYVEKRLNLSIQDRWRICAVEVKEHPEMFGVLNAIVQPLLRSKRLAELWLDREESESTECNTLGPIL